MIGLGIAGWLWFVAAGTARRLPQSGGNYNCVWPQEGGDYNFSWPQQGGNFNNSWPQQDGNYNSWPQEGGNYSFVPQEGGYSDLLQQGGYSEPPQQGGYRDWPQEGGYRDLPQEGGMEFDSKLLGKPQAFSGKDEEWADWSFTTRAYLDCLDESMSDALDLVTAGDRPLVLSAMSAPDPANSRKVYYILAQLLRGPPLLQLRQTEKGNGFLCWRKLHERDTIRKRRFERTPY